MSTDHRGPSRTKDPLIMESLTYLLTTQPGGPHRPAETLADMLNEHLQDLARAAERIADSLEEIAENMPRRP